MRRLIAWWWDRNPPTCDESRVHRRARLVAGWLIGWRSPQLGHADD